MLLNQVESDKGELGFMHDLGAVAPPHYRLGPAISFHADRVVL